MGERVGHDSGDLALVRADTSASIATCDIQLLAAKQKRETSGAGLPAGARRGGARWHEVASRVPVL
jgi:hypothetical protein